MAKYKTTFSLDSTGHDHDHLISNPESGLTDPAADGHVHEIAPTCKPCWKARSYIGQKLTTTKWHKGHLHYFEIQALYDPNREQE